MQTVPSFALSLVDRLIEGATLDREEIIECLLGHADEFQGLVEMVAQAEAASYDEVATLEEHYLGLQYDLDRKQEELDECREELEECRTELFDRRNEVLDCREQLKELRRQLAEVTCYA